jgi:hypothetical protein
MPLYSVRLELARTKDFPEGHAGHGYEFVAPLDEQGNLIAAEWIANKARCVVRRFMPGTDDEHGRFAHVGKGWHFDYDAHRRDDDEPLFKLDRHLIREGYYLSVTEHDGVSRPFRIVAVQPL